MLDDIKADGLTALVEVYDRDIIGGDDFIGRVTFDYVRFSDKIYKYPRLNWYDVWLNGHEGGQLLMALESIQISETDSTEDYPRSHKVALPKYKLQVIFWGVRNLGRVKFLSVDKPKAN
uniref:C2 domain-containing protein n=1 Tax=Tetranychus urticae TaxID=32264 RepID=T1K6Z6_TETUR